MEVRNSPTRGRTADNSFFLLSFFFSFCRKGRLQMVRPRRRIGQPSELCHSSMHHDPPLLTLSFFFTAFSCDFFLSRFARQCFVAANAEACPAEVPQDTDPQICQEAAAAPVASTACNANGRRTCDDVCGVGLVQECDCTIPSRYDGASRPRSSAPYLTRQPAPRQSVWSKASLTTPPWQWPCLSAAPSI